MIFGRVKLSKLHRKRGGNMDTNREQIKLFLRRCDELMQSKYIIADTKIGELLKAIVTSDLLYAFFRDITKDFDYDAAQRKYMNYYPEGTTNKRKLLFPEDPAERLAFVFCLLVDFDSKRIDLGDFLQEYFYEDGSFSSGYAAFINAMLLILNALEAHAEKGSPALIAALVCGYHYFSEQALWKSEEAAEIWEKFGNAEDVV